LFIDPSADFDFVDPIQLPDLVLDLFSIHKAFRQLSKSQLSSTNVVQLNRSHLYSSG
jgi:hypothetical protein